MSAISHQNVSLLVVGDGEYCRLLEILVSGLYALYLAVVHHSTFFCVVFHHSCRSESEPYCLSVGSEYRLHALFESWQQVFLEWRWLVGEMQYAVAHGRNPDVAVFAHYHVVAQVGVIACNVLQFVEMAQVVIVYGVHAFTTYCHHGVVEWVFLQAVVVVCESRHTPSAHFLASWVVRLVKSFYAMSPCAYP